MRNWSCKSIFGKKDKYSQKIDVISNRMKELEKDIEAIKMKSISPILSPKPDLNEIDIKKNNNKNEEAKNNLYYVNNNKKKFLNINRKNITNVIHKTKSCSIIPRDKLEYEYELRILRRKIESLKEENQTLKNKVINLKDKNDYIEYNINSIRNTYSNNNTNNNYEENKNDNKLLDDISNIKYKKRLIEKIIKICKNNINYYNSYENNNNKKESSILNLLLNIMDFRYSYENALLNNSFFSGIEMIIQNGHNNKNFYVNNKNKIVNYINDLINKEKKLKKINEVYKNSKKYYDLCKHFSSVKNIDNYLNKIIAKNIKVEQSINKIRNVLKNENLLKNNNKLLQSNPNKKKMMENYFNRNRRNKNFHFGKNSIYQTDFYKGYNYNNDNYTRNNDFYRKMMKLNDSSALKSEKIINYTNNNYNESKNKSMNNMKKSFSVTVSNKNPKNFNQLYYNSYSLSNNSKFNS